ncbi:MAG: helix-turn-helix domain-containing protein [Lachnospiraceae bacterium]|nr:helix-turn-helix domain-containing protein [Lachnospiraceae bacterium]
MKREKLLEKLEGAGQLTILDANGKKLMSISAAELEEAIGSKDSPEALYSDIIEGRCDDTEMITRASTLGIKDDVRRALYLLKLEPDVGNDVKEAAAELLRELYSADKSAVVFNSGSHDLILVHALSSKKGSEQLKENADSALSMLNTELMIKLRISYGSAAAKLGNLSDSMREARFAMKVMNLFYEERLVADYASLGIGGMVSDLSDEACERFLSECFGSKLRSKLDEEELQMVNRFFEKDLNISETARELYLHRNTLVYHLEKLQKKTGLDIRNFEDACRLKLALMIESRLYQKGEH